MKKYSLLTSILLAGYLCANGNEAIPTLGEAVFNFGKQNDDFLQSENWMDSNWNKVLFNSAFIQTAPNKNPDIPKRISLLQGFQQGKNCKTYILSAHIINSDTGRDPTQWAISRSALSNIHVSTINSGTTSPITLPSLMPASWTTGMRFSEINFNGDKKSELSLLLNKLAPTPSQRLL